MAAQEAEAARSEAARAVVEEVQRLLAAGEPVPEHLLPPAMREGGGGAAGGKKGAGKDKAGGGDKQKPGAKK